ncbi:MAG TPA: hypothetical protein PKI03_23935 [Pseudomonadota bacterium]|nr:hypothetical protein [Pseudomonadota bacterium]
MQRRALLRLGLSATATSLASALPGRRCLAAANLAPPPLQRGVALGLFCEDPMWSYRELLTEIRDLGATHVSLTVAYYQQHGGSTRIYSHPRFTAPDYAVIRTIREAHALGLQVLLFPILRLESPRSDREWRGTLSPEKPEVWWASYEALMLRLAQLAARERVEVLSIGSEQSTLDVAPLHARWARLVSTLQRHYHGLLTYSGNWDHYANVGLYDLVDLVGMCAYFPLASEGYKPPAKPEDLAAAWRKKRQELETFAQGLGKPLLLTEVGYLSQRGGAAWPWREGSAEPIDLEDQRRCYAAFAEAWAGSKTLRGVYFWNYYGWGGQISSGYTPRHKPASDEIIRYFISEEHRPAR